MVSEILTCVLMLIPDIALMEGIKSHTSLQTCILTCYLITLSKYVNKDRGT